MSLVVVSLFFKGGLGSLVVVVVCIFEKCSESSGTSIELKRRWHGPNVA